MKPKKTKNKNGGSGALAADKCSCGRPRVEPWIKPWCKYSRGVTEENKGHLKRDESGLGGDPGRVRGGTKEACQKAPAVVFQCQIVPRACCYSTPSICIRGTPAIPLHIKALQLIYNQLLPRRLTRPESPLMIFRAITTNKHRSEAYCT